MRTQLNKINEAINDNNDIIDDSNIKHFESYNKSKAKKHGRKILLSQLNGALATITRSNRPLEGFPMGSVVPYIIDNHGDIIFLISDIAEHTKNINANPKASLLIHDNDANNVQQSWRLTAIGNTKLIEDEQEIKQVSEQYYRFYPKSINYHSTHNFHFYKLSTIKYRIIMDFGKIAWVDNEDFISSTPFNFENETAMINHMNEDHCHNMFHYLKCLGVETDHNNRIEMVKINQYGCHIRHNDIIHYIEFDDYCEDPIAVRHALVRLAKAPLPGVEDNIN